MTDLFSEMQTTCHAMAEYVMRMPCQGNRSKWLREQLSHFLTNPEQIKAFQVDYAQNYRYAHAPTEYLAEVQRAYDENLD